MPVEMLFPPWKNRIDSRLPGGIVTALFVFVQPSVGTANGGVV